jgi:gamma-glutamylcyclotransferase (GGCT)/AIG2-like uncharacterized protein YtfP
MLYFSYGSNMSLRRLAARVPSAQVVCNARLDGHALKFHKKSNKDGSAKCDAAHTGQNEDIVIGVVFDIDPSHKAKLDACEGLGYGYETKTVSLLSDRGEKVEAFTYYATLIDAALQPFHWYKEHVLRGARENGLPGDYVMRIEEVVSIDDPDNDRHERELAIYL